VLNNIYLPSFKWSHLDGSIGMTFSVSRSWGSHAVSTKIAVFWVVAPCRLVWVYRRFRGLYCLQHHGALKTAIFTFSEGTNIKSTSTFQYTSGLEHANKWVRYVCSRVQSLVLSQEWVKRSHFSYRLFIRSYFTYNEKKPIKWAGAVVNFCGLSKLTMKEKSKYSRPISWQVSGNAKRGVFVALKHWICVV
jgi:hypothetical protein